MRREVSLENGVSCDLALLWFSGALWEFFVYRRFIWGTVDCVRRPFGFLTYQRTDSRAAFAVGRVRVGGGTRLTDEKSSYRQWSLSWAFHPSHDQMPTRLPSDECTRFVLNVDTPDAFFTGSLVSWTENGCRPSPLKLHLCFACWRWTGTIRADHWAEPERLWNCCMRFWSEATHADITGNVKRELIIPET